MKDAHGHGSDAHGAAGPAPPGMEHQFALANMHGIDVSHISAAPSAEGHDLWEALSGLAAKDNSTPRSGWNQNSLENYDE